MGAIGGLLGTAGGASGTGFAKPVNANVQGGTNQAQIANAANANQNSLASQQALLKALQSQNGLGVQSSATNQQQSLANQLAGNNGAAHNEEAYNQTQQLANQQAATNAVGSQQSALSQQQMLNNQLAGNNGAAHNEEAYNQTQELANQLGNANGVGNLSNALTSQQALAAQQYGTAAQYQGIANGTGPNPAQAALNQATGQNIANQAALMAGQRGASANVGLLARQIAQQGAATQQQAVGQGATMQAQQELNALQGLSGQQQAIGNTQQNVANIAAQQVGMTQAQQQALAAQSAQQIGLQQSGIGAQQAAAYNLVGQQQAQQQALAAQSAQQIGLQQQAQSNLANQGNTLANQQIGATTANTQAQQSEQQILQNALASSNNNQVGMQSNINSGNAGLAQTQMTGQHGLIGGVAQGVGSALGFAKGGLTEKPEKFADGGNPITQISPIAPVTTPQSSQGPVSSFGKFLQGFSRAQPTDINQSMQNMDDKIPQNGHQALNKGMSNLIQGAYKKLSTPSNGMPQTNNYAGSDISDTQFAAADGGLAKKHDYTSGGNVKAKSNKEKAIKPGNSYDNDKIPAFLSEDEIVLPRNVTQSEDPIRAAGEFVAKVLAKKRKSA